MNFQPKILNFQMALDYINIIDHKKIHQKIPRTTLFLKYVCNFSYFMMNIISSQIHFNCCNLIMFVKKNVN
jgi:hypothetical protein